MSSTSRYSTGTKDFLKQWVLGGTLTAFTGENIWSREYLSGTFRSTVGKIQIGPWVLGGTLTASAGKTISKKEDYLTAHSNKPAPMRVSD